VAANTADDRFSVELTPGQTARIAAATGSVLEVQRAPEGAFVPASQHSAEGGQGTALVAPLDVQDSVRSTPHPILQPAPPGATTHHPLHPSGSIPIDGQLLSARDARSAEEAAPENADLFLVRSDQDFGLAAALPMHLEVCEGAQVLPHRLNLAARR
jgi:hypothetical protein